jgi:hypothetical protein
VFTKLNLRGEGLHRHVRLGKITPFPGHHGCAALDEEKKTEQRKKTTHAIECEGVNGSEKVSD